MQRKPATGRGGHAYGQEPQPRQARSPATVTPTHRTRCQSWLPRYPDDLHFSSSSWGRHSGVINSHVHVCTQTAGSARQRLAHWLSRQGRSSVASCHGGGCLELQPRSRRWGVEGTLSPRWEVVTLPPHCKGNVPHSGPSEGSVLRKLSGHETNVPAQKGCAVLYVTVLAKGQ